MAFDRFVKSVAPQYGLYPYQRQVLKDVLSELHPTSRDILPRQRRVIAHMPTGAGKTRMACHAAVEMLVNSNSEDSFVVWLASTEELCAQAAEALETAWSCLGNREVTFHRFWGASTIKLNEISGGFLIGGLPKMWMATSGNPGLLTALSHRVAGVIFDEAHQSVARTYHFVTERLLAYNPPLLGLTATPGRTHDIGEDDYRLSDMFMGNRVSIDPQGHPTALHYLISDDYLALPTFLEVETDSAANISESFFGMDYSSSYLSELGSELKRNNVVVDTTIEALQRHRRVIVFCPSVQSAAASCEEIRAAGFNADYIVAGTPSDERGATLDKFRNRDPRPMALLNYGVLTAGFDAPSTSCVVVARPTRSLVMYSQMIGRAMRGRHSGGNRRCEIFTVVDSNLSAFRSIVEAFKNWEELWYQDIE